MRRAMQRLSPRVSPRNTSSLGASDGNLHPLIRRIRLRSTNAASPCEQVPDRNHQARGRRRGGTVQHGIALMGRYAFTVSDPAVEAHITVTAVADSGRVVAEDVHVRRRLGGPPVTWQVLRQGPSTPTSTRAFRSYIRRPSTRVRSGARSRGRTCTWCGGGQPEPGVGQVAAAAGGAAGPCDGPGVRQLRA